MQTNKIHKSPWNERGLFGGRRMVPAEPSAREVTGRRILRVWDFSCRRVEIRPTSPTPKEIQVLPCCSRSNSPPTPAHVVCGFFEKFRRSPPHLNSSPAPMALPLCGGWALPGDTHARYLEKQTKTKKNQVKCVREGLEGGALAQVLAPPPCPSPPPLP